jgi:perosamine synthetase
MPVHVFGRVAPMQEIRDIAHARGIYVLEDCAEAHGASYRGKPIGAWSDIASFSFFANKILTTGEGGMCITNVPVLAERMRVLRDHGMRPERRYWHEEVGYNYRMTNLQAAIGCAQLARKDELLGMRRRVQDLYVKHLTGLPGVTMPPPLPADYGTVAWFACAQVPAGRRAELISACKAAKIDLRPFFNNLSLMPAYKRFAKVCPVSEHLSQTGVNLPTAHTVDENVVQRVAEVFKRELSG